MPHMTAQRRWIRRSQTSPSRTQCRQRSTDRLGGSGLTGRALAARRTELAKGDGGCDGDSQQRDDRERAVGDGFLGPYQRDEQDDPEESGRGQCHPHRKGRRTPELIERCSPSPVHARCPSTRHKMHSAKRMTFSPHSASCRMVLRTGPFDGGWNGIHRPCGLFVRKCRADFPWPPVRKPRSSF